MGSRATTKEERKRIERWERWRDSFLDYRKTYDDLLFNAYEILSFPTGMNYVEISELPNFYLLELLDDFKPRLEQIQKMREAKQVEGLFGGKG